MNRYKQLNFRKWKKNQIIASLAFSLLIFISAYILRDLYALTIGPEEFLLFHTVLEILSILVSFTIFLLAYYTYDYTKSLRSSLSGSLFLSVSIIDLFHLLSYKGMPWFVIDNFAANRTTTFWVAARLIAAIGFCILSKTPIKSKSRAKKSRFFLPPVLLSLIIFVIATYFPNIYPQMYIEGYGPSIAKKFLEIAIIVIMINAANSYYKSYKRDNDDLFIYLMLAMVIGIFGELAFVLYESVYDIINFVGHLFKAISYFIIFRVLFVSSVLNPYRKLYYARLSLYKHSRSLDKMVDMKTEELKKANRELLNDMKYAKDIQNAMLPKALPSSARVSFYSEYMPADRLSGDFYDYFMLDDQHYGFYISDVSGHGVSASMLTIYLKQCIEARKDLDMYSNIISFPSVVMDHLFDSFNNTSFKDDTYIVIIYCIYNSETHRLIYCSAGMNTPPLILKSTGEVVEMEIQGMPICKIRDIYDVEYVDTFLDLNEGDKLFFYTDGLIDAQDMEGKRYSRERLIELLSEHSSKSSSSLFKILSDDLKGFIKDNKITDDITYFFMEVNS